MDEERRPDGARAGRPFDDVGQARRFQRKLGEARHGRHYEARPSIEYDESGYPVEDEKPGLASRLIRLITG